MEVGPCIPVLVQLQKVEIGPTPAYDSCTPVGMDGPTCIVWANLTPFALQLGCRVVGVAGPAEKCAFVTDVLGFD